MPTGSVTAALVIAAALVLPAASYHPDHKCAASTSLIEHHCGGPKK